MNVYYEKSNAVSLLDTKVPIEVVSAPTEVVSNIESSKNGSVVYDFDSTDDKSTKPSLQNSLEEPILVIEGEKTEFVDEKKIRESMLALIGEHCCWGSRAAKNMKITNIIPFESYHCMWECYMEIRYTTFEFRAYYGESVGNGTPPDLWEIPMAVPDMFVETSYERTIPHTEAIDLCYVCTGRGSVTCSNCNGNGRVECNRCSGSGQIVSGEKRETCYSCNGTGRVRCSYCSGSGSKECTKCYGSGKLVKYDLLHVEFVNHIFNSCVDESHLPDDVICNAAGSTLLDQTGIDLTPPQDIKSEDVKNACTAVYEEALALINLKTGRLHQQRVCVRTIPITKASGDFKKRNFDIWVYGDDGICYVPEYPMQKCCGCFTC